jgi:hypothetical protein
VNYVVLFNRRLRPGPSYNDQIRDLIDDILDNTPIAWPNPRHAVRTTRANLPPDRAPIVAR